ncbi:unnamed protein product [Medioppia subpectinata]|uniref:Elongator complex protein 5 n=1 Tax=Medioppia subpectinata TaxID=1979941 RepID=A0A7R9KT25_9ACAR|nr:unnamed protein product [Medioppia subpectinata]CAG2109350.1 unnamed protein product [Medioppia subpectinata]
MLLLSKVVTTDHSSRFTLICDHLACDSRQLVRAVIGHRLRQLPAIVVCVEKPANVWLKSFDPSLTDRLRVVDLFNAYHTIDDNFGHHLMRELDQLDGESVVVIDSLTPILLMDSLHESVCLLNQLMNRFKQLVSVLHVDCHSQHVNESVEQLSHSVIHLSPKITDNSVECFKAIIRHRKPHRKTHFAVQQSIEFFTISDCNIVYVKDINETLNGQSFGDQSSADPTLNIPFNLSLKSSELEAKNNLLLPYIKTHEETKVFYEFDKNDDIDEEDPDEDLDI